MPLYKIEISETAVKQLNKLPHNVTEDLITVIQSLADNPRPNGCKKLKEEKVIGYVKAGIELYMTCTIKTS